jgi:hypothetical protein
MSEFPYSMVSISTSRKYLFSGNSVNRSFVRLFIFTSIHV